MLAVTQLMGFGAGGARRKFRFFRINVTATESNTDVSIGELKIFEGAVENPTSNMTSDTAPSPLVSSASATNPPQVAWKGFDGIDDGADANWSTGAAPTQWLKIDLGSGNDIGVTSIKMVARTGSQTHQPKDFTFEGSDTGSFSGEETTLLTVTGEPAWSGGEERTYNV